MGVTDGSGKEEEVEKKEERFEGEEMDGTDGIEIDPNSECMVELKRRNSVLRIPGILDKRPGCTCDIGASKQTASLHWREDDDCPYMSDQHGVIYKQMYEKSAFFGPKYTEYLQKKRGEGQ